MENKIGLWKKISQKGNEYYTGKIVINKKEYTISLFKNNYKENDKQPDYQIILKEKENKRKNDLSEEVFANFGNETDEIKDEDLAF